MPPLEAWEKVLINLGKYDSVGELDSHLKKQTCTDCHGGDSSEQDDPALAHAGLILDPSSIETNVCAECHEEIAQNVAGSMHQNLWGEQTAIAARAGVATFAECPKALKDGFAGECASCHATCGDCHVSRPDSVGKGFIKSHTFRKKPHQKNQCMACHGSRVAHDFMGDDETGRKPDVHFAKGMDCMDCHSGKEMHASAIGVPDRYHLPEAPTCEGCHAVQAANMYHQMHWDSVSCHVCHAQPYNSCTGCHTGGEWKKDAEYLEINPAEDFRIGRNPLPDRRFDFVTLRHVPVVPTSFNPWGGEDLLPAYDSVPTWKYTTPHSIRRWTPRTQNDEGLGCGAGCHLGAPADGSPANADLYLWAAEIEEQWPVEAGANDGVVVDGWLPNGWE